MRDFWFNRPDRNLSVSSHLTPDPEKRLRNLYAYLSDELRFMDYKLFFIVLASLVELSALVRYSTYASVLLCFIIMAALLGISPLTEIPQKIKFLDIDSAKNPDSIIIGANDIAGYSCAELVNFLDRYLGGGISATPLYEDIVSRILITSRVTVRKRKLFFSSCVLLAAMQLLIAIVFINPF